MHKVKIKWIDQKDGGRKSPPSLGKYFSVARFPEDTQWQNNAWSVVFILESLEENSNGCYSIGLVDFIMENAPKERLYIHDKFDIYEGPKMVANVYLIKDN